jgi:outer membrane protein W
MKSYRAVIVLMMAVLLAALTAFGQGTSMRGRSCIEIQFGLWNEMKAGNELAPAGVTSAAKSSGFLGGLSYSYWLRERVALSLTTGVIAGEASSSVIFSGLSEQRTSSVIPILLGMKYYLLEPETGEAVRPYAAAAVGSFLGFEASNSVFSQSAHSESALGARVGAGVDFLVASWLKIGASVGYNAMTDFRTPVGARSNYSGPDFSLGLGFLFGGSQSD